MKPKVCALALVTLLCTGINSQSLPAKMHFPEQGRIKFSFKVPEGWTTRVENSNRTLIVRAPGAQAAVMILTVFDAPNEQGSLEDVAKTALEVAKSQPYTKEEDTSLSGVAGKTFYSTTNLGGDVNFNLRMSIFKIGTTYLSTTEVLRVGKTEEEHQQLASLGIAIDGAN